ncbi:MAG: hypothetical protein ACE15C_01355 [Phycisphaerae bacterium]
MDISEDFRELCELLNSQGAEYVIVGGYAVGFHGAPRFTADIDFFVRPTEQNYTRIVAALEAFGFGSVGLTLDEFLLPGRIIQIGVEPNRVDLITSITGVSWEEADRGKVAGQYGGVPVFYIGRQELLKNKAASARKKDLADVEALDRKGTR